MTDDLAKRRDLRLRKRTAAPIGAFGGLSGAKSVAANRALAKVEAAEDLRRIAAGEKTPTPERITSALTLRNLYGPEVDEALGGAEPMVDEWESGERVPTYEQVQALARLTDFPIRFFYLPAPPPFTEGFLCTADGCGPLG